MKVTTGSQTQTAAIIGQLTDALNGSHAHASLDDALGDIRQDLLGIVPQGLPYSIWQLVEHIRITQWDILEFSRNPGHQSPEWPKGYWPAETAPAHPKDWKRSVDQITADRKAFIQLLHKGGEGIYDAFEWGDGQSLFREAILIVDHTSYHTGEIIVVRRLLNNWK